MTIGRLLPNSFVRRPHAKSDLIARGEVTIDQYAPDLIIRTDIGSSRTEEIAITVSVSAYPTLLARMIEVDRDATVDAFAKAIMAHQRK